MQLKLLNFYQILSKIATSIIGAFMALIIYQSTGSFTWAFAYLVGYNALRATFQILLNKFFAKYPQLFLVLRIIPFLIYSLSIFLLDTPAMILGVILILIFYSLSEVMGAAPIDYVFSYNTGSKTSSSLGIIRVMETGGALLAMLLGGLFLDNLNRWVLIFLSCVLYFISAVPLLIYYFRYRGSKGFNVESTSNATVSLNKNKNRQIQHRMISHEILKNYFIMYILLCFYDFTMTLISLYIFKVNAASYSLSAYVQMAYNGCYGLGSFVAGRMDQKHDITPLAIIGPLICGTCIGLSPFLVGSVPLVAVVIGISGFFESFVSLFLYSRMVSRCKILGISNESLHLRRISTYVSQGTLSLLCIIGPFMFIPAFFAISLTSILLSIGLPRNEEVSRKMLVDYLQENSL